MEAIGKLHAAVSLPLGKESLVPFGKEAAWAPKAGVDEGAKKN
jgi:hypothetical protein